MREIHMSKGSFVIGHEHKTRHLNVVLQGKAHVAIDGEVKIIEAPYTFMSEPGVRKVLYIEDDMIWATIHPTDETDLEKLEELLIVKSPVFENYQNDLRKLGGI